LDRLGLNRKLLDLNLLDVYTIYLDRNILYCIILYIMMNDKIIAIVIAFIILLIGIIAAFITPKNINLRKEK
jgi:hypothetical protein